MLVTDRRAWGLLLVSALGLELTALWFQYGMGLDPCVMCVYQRLAIFGLIVAGVLGFVYPMSAWLRLPAYAVWGASAGWGLSLALEHVAIQSDDGFAFTCSFAAEFPVWAKLDEWFPSIFMPTGYCDDVKWQFLGFSMPQWMVVVFAGYLLILAVVLFLEIRRLTYR